jgi:hypothetical protein
MKKVNSRSVLATVFVAVFLLLFAAGPASLLAMEDKVFEAPDEGSFNRADAAFDVKPASDEGKSSVYEDADAAFSEAPISAIVNTAGAADTTQKFGAYSETNMGSIPASVAATMSYDQYEAFKRSKAEAYALTDASYGTSEFIPSRQEALERLVQQAKDMQFSQELIDELAGIFRLKDYVEYDYNVKFGKNPDNYLRLLREQHNVKIRQLKKQEQFQRQLDRIKAEQARYNNKGGGVNVDVATVTEVAPEDNTFTQGPGGVSVDPTTGKPFFGPGSAGYQDYLNSQKLREDINKFAGSQGAQEIPDDVVSSIEASVHNAILDKLKAKGHDVAALNVFLQNLSEVKVIAIITTSELPKSAIRATLRSIRSLIENEVLATKFKALRLAQLSSFTLLNEVDNTFYEHPVLYWQMQLTGWDTKGRRVSPGTPAMSDIMPQSDSSPEADALLSEFLGN